VNAGRLMSSQESYDFEIEVDKNTKLKCFDCSLRCSRPDLITVWILRRIKGHWKKIGKANIVIDSRTMARWGNIANKIERFLPVISHSIKPHRMTSSKKKL